MVDRQKMAYTALAITVFLFWAGYTVVSEHIPAPDATDLLLQIPPTGISHMLHEKIAGTVLEDLLLIIYLYVYLASIPMAVWYAVFREPNLAARTLGALAVLMVLSCIIYTAVRVTPPHRVYGENPLEGTMQRRWVNDKMVLPSLHAGIVTIFVVVFWNARNKAVKWFYTVLAPLVWISAIALLQHWFHDIVTGILFGVFSLLITRRIERHLERFVRNVSERYVDIWLALSILLAAVLAAARMV